MLEVKAIRVSEDLNLREPFCRKYDNHIEVTHIYTIQRYIIFIREELITTGSKASRGRIGL